MNMNMNMNMKKTKEELTQEILDLSHELNGIVLDYVNREAIIINELDLWRIEAIAKRISTQIKAIDASRILDWK